MALCTLWLISYHTAHHSAAVGTSVGLTGFSLMITVSAFQARSETATALTTTTLDNKNLNWTAAGEVVLAILITQMDVMRRIFGTTQIDARQWLTALVPAIALFFVWEIGKAIGRRAPDGEAPGG